VKLPLDTPEFYARIVAYSPVKRVPVLIDGDVHIWDSLAICEHANDYFLNGCGWPADRAARGSARAISAEMHAGFGALREALPMDCGKRVTRPALGAAVAADIERICAIWRDARARHAAQGPFLFGGFCIADAMYAPVALRFASYGIEPGAIEHEYMQTLLALPALREWLDAAATEAPMPQSEPNLP
jgi:glutathione S-transferase